MKLDNTSSLYYHINMNCSACSYKWQPRIKSPRACPKCKTYLNYSNSCEWCSMQYPEQMLCGIDEKFKRLCPGCNYCFKKGAPRYDG